MREGEIVQPDQLADFCKQVPLLRRAFRGEQHARTRALVEQAVSEIQAGNWPAELLSSLGLGKTGPIPEPQRHGGPPPPGSSSPSDGGIPGVFGASRQVDGQYLCPKGRCARAVQRAPGDPVPTCALFDADLRFFADD